MSSVYWRGIKINIQGAENLLHIFGKRRFEFHIALFPRMNKTDTRGMKHLPFYGGYQLGVLLQKAFFQSIGSMAINRVPHQGIPQMGEMNPNLMGSTGLNGNG